jgi:hypothetical protein
VQTNTYIYLTLLWQVKNNPLPPFQICSTSGIAKRPCTAAELQEAQKKQAADGKLKPFMPVINHMVVTNSMLCKKVIMTVALPGNVLSQNQTIVKYAPGLNGGGLLLWIPCGQVTSNTDKLRVVYLNLEARASLRLMPCFLRKHLQPS